MLKPGLQRSRFYLIAVSGLAAMALVSEVAVRLAGFVDWPLYDADAIIGYIPKANQKGRFMDRNDWEFNAFHMGAGPFIPDSRRNILLIGDSIVLGGNPYAMPERLGPQLERRIGGKVWPVGAGSWSLQNELTYLALQPDVVGQVDTVAFVLNSGDLAEASSWGCTLTHPRERPASALWFLAAKYVLHTPCEGTPPDMKVARKDPLAMLTDFMRSRPSTRVVVFLYPDLPESSNERLRQSRLEAMRPLLSKAGVREIVSVGELPTWAGHPEYYRDGIHPSPVGNQVLAQIMSSALASNAN